MGTKRSDAEDGSNVMVHDGTSTPWAMNPLFSTTKMPVDKVAILGSPESALAAVATLAALKAPAKPEAPKAAKLSIVLWDDPILSRQSLPIPPEKFGTDLLELGRRMLASIGDHGIGLAAPQVGMSMRLFVMAVRGKDDEAIEEIVLANPVMAICSGRTATAEEGCLSFPGLYGPVTRYEAVDLAWQDPVTGEERKRYFDGLQAACVQHEIDHLDGIMFFDRARMKNGWRKKLLKQWERRR
jgi:peptide deformylase